jgi:ubiquinone/menaquinone biosynthesis C-methylase UbiE
MSVTTYKEGWNSIDRSDDPLGFVRFMDRVNGDDSEQTFLRLSDTIRQLEVQPGNQVLEIGCGTGGAARALAHLAGPDGRVTAVDISETMLAEAQARTEGLGINVDYMIADAHALPFADNRFDRCCARNVFEIIDDPGLVMREMVRVLRPGGKVVVPAADYGSLTIHSDDHGTTRAIINFISEKETNGWIGRGLPFLFQEAGIADIEISVEASVCNDFRYFFEAWLNSYITNAVAAGVLTVEQATTWLEEQVEHARRNLFFAVHTTFLVTGRKP